mgnify:CR=1 FL=1
MVALSSIVSGNKSFMNLQKLFRYFIRAKVLFLFTFSEFCDIISSPIGGYMEVLIDNDLIELDKLDYLAILRDFYGYAEIVQ